MLLIAPCSLFLARNRKVNELKVYGLPEEYVVDKCVGRFLLFYFKIYQPTKIKFLRKFLNHLNLLTSSLSVHIASKSMIVFFKTG